MEKKITEDDQLLVTVDYLASLFNRDVRTIQNWAEKEGMPREKRGVYDLIACVKWKYQKQLEEIKVLEDSGDKNVHAEKFRGEQINNSIRELKYKKLIGELIEIDAVRLAWVGEIKTFRKALNAMVPKLEAALENIHDRSRRREIIYKHVHEVLMNLSENLRIENDEDITADLDQLSLDITNQISDNE